MSGLRSGTAAAAGGDWFSRRTHRRGAVDPAAVLAAKGGRRVAVVLPARDEAATVGAVVTGVRRAWLEAVPLVDEVVVMDSDSVDDTGAVARAAGATVHRVRDVRPDLGGRPGKGEAIWKAQLVVDADVLVFVDADLTESAPDLVPALLAPLLADDTVALVKGFYDRPLRDGSPTAGEAHGGRVTELVARPLLTLLAPELADVVQPLAGEWAVRADHLASLSVPSGYGVDVAVLLDTVRAAGLDAVAQVDLGLRAHTHHGLADLGPMATQVMAAVLARRPHGPLPAEVCLRQFRRDAAGDPQPVERAVPLDERPPAAAVRAPERAS